MSRRALRWMPIQITAVISSLVVFFAITDMVGLTNVQLLVINITDSMPRGIYIRSFETIHRGSIVTIPMPEIMREYVRAYPAWDRFFDSHRLLKNVVAIHGDTICRIGQRFSVNETVLASAEERGPDSRLLPTWQGCKRLMQDEIAVYSDGLRDSLDSRYWGPTPSSTARVYRSVWTWH